MNDLWKEITSDINGIKTLNEWLGEGGEPVSHEEAESRALVCARCPENKKGNWWDTAKTIVADNIRRHISVKNKLELSTIHDPEIGTCKVCYCNIPLMVHCPEKILKEHTPVETLEEYPLSCWKLKLIRKL